MSHTNYPVNKTPSQKTETKSVGSQSQAENNEAERRRKHSELSQGPGLLEMVAGDEPEDEKLVAHSSSIIKFYPDWCQCFKGTSEPLAENATFVEHCQDFFSCPPRGTFARLLLCILICIFLWGFMFFLFKPLASDRSSEHHEMATNPAWIDGPIFGLAIIEITGLISGILLKKFLNLPPLLGPLILGIVYRNSPPLNVFLLMTHKESRHCNATDKYCLHTAENSLNDWVKPIRVIALGIILTRAGLELSPKQLSKLKGVVPLLAFGPCIVEGCVCAVTSYVFFNVMEEKELSKMELAMCFVGGFALAAVSPAVVVPGALSLKKSGYGVVKGVPTLLIAASSIDDVLAISVYTIALGFAIKQSSGAAWQSYSAGIIGLVVGIVHGVMFGMVLHFLPTRNSKYKAHNRLLLLLLINFTSVLFYEETFINGAGSISVLVTSLIAGFGWRSQPHWKLPMHKIERMLAHMWVLWVPLIFGTIGKEINFKAKAFQPPVIYKIFGVLFISLVSRCLTAFFAAGCGTGFNMKERIFIALSWIPKATVQAALAPLVLTRAAEQPENETNEGIKYNAEIVVNIAILAVLITAPVGCVLIALVGPKFLKRNTSPEISQQIEQEFPNGEGIDPEESTYALVEEAIKPYQDARASSLEDVVAVIPLSAPLPSSAPPPPTPHESILSKISR